MNTKIIEENIEETNGESEKDKKIRDEKNSKLLKAFQNNLEISNLGLHNKFDSFEHWEYMRSQRLLYETTLDRTTKYKRYPRGSIIEFFPL